MKILKMGGVVLLSLGIGACATSGYDAKYTKNDKQINSAVSPSGIAKIRQQGIYVVPKVANNGLGKPSLLPPGLHVKTFQDKIQKQKIKQPKPISRADQQALSVELKTRPEQSWAKLTDVLKKDHYKVLDQDTMIKTYYVIPPDAIKMASHIGSKMAPIFRVSIEPTDDHSILTLKNQQNHPVHTQAAEQAFAEISRDLT